MFNLGFSEVILIAIIALIFIGPKQLPEMARTIGRVLNELKRASNDLSSNFLNPDSYKPPTKTDLPIKSEQVSAAPPPAEVAHENINPDTTPTEKKS
jgi:sec-independent protein translocase protein TatB